jgi:hypothetical protein
MNPTKIWKANKWRVDLRGFTREFQQKFNVKEKININPGTIYACKYMVDRSIPTDKHHFTPLIISFGRFKDDNGKTHIRGINLFYLRTDQKLEIMDETFKYNSLKPDARVAPMIKIHEKWMKIAPYAFKNLEERRILGISEVDSNDWGMLPLLKDHLLGNFNVNALNEDFKEEIANPPSKLDKKKDTPIKPEEEVTDDEENEFLSDSPISSQFIDNDFEDYDI